MVSHLAEYSITQPICLDAHQSMLLQFYHNEMIVQ
nr:MAG TPA: hypothetical protein [Caudoviricetes sp.]